MAVGRDTGSGSSRPHYERRRVGCCNGAGDPVIHWSRDGGGPAMPAMPARLPRSKLGSLPHHWRTSLFHPPPPRLSLLSRPINRSPCSSPPTSIRPLTIVGASLVPHSPPVTCSPLSWGLVTVPPMSYLGESPRPTNIRPSSAQLLSANKSRSILRGRRCDSFGSDMTLACTGLRLVRHSALSAETHLIHSLTQIVVLIGGTMGSHLIPLSPSAVTIHLIHAH